VFQANPGVLLTLDNQMHGLEDGDKSGFKEIVGMSSLNDTTQTVKGNTRERNYTHKNLTTCQQDVFATGLWQACQQVVTMLLFYQVATRLSLTTC
jgi:hypothetical protein